MKNRQPLARLLVGFVIISPFLSEIKAEDWPMRIGPDLSSGFGEFRQGRFHSGVDLRTRGRIGRKVFSPVDGYVSRVKMSYTGYGKGLYLISDDGFIYVFAHLSEFVPEIDKHVKQAQLAVKRYYIDHYFQKDSIRITKGQLIAHSGQTGVGAPHLHLEKRTANNVPLNPLVHGFNLNDTEPPIFSSLGFELTGDEDLLADGSRGMQFKVEPSENSTYYTIPEVIMIDREFGVLTGCYDRMRAEGMKQTVYKMALSVDGKPIYSSVLDSIPFSRGSLVNLEYDLESAVDSDKLIRRLYTQIDNWPTQNNPNRSQDGVIGNTFPAGLHHAMIEATDNFGNSSRLNFDFLWSGGAELYVKDSMVRVNDSLRNFYFSGQPGVAQMGIDSISIEINLGDNWSPLLRAEVTEKTNQSLIIEIQKKRSRSLILRMRYYSSHGPSFTSEPFNGIRPSGQKDIQIEHTVMRDGLLVTALSRARAGLRSRVMLYNGDKLLGTHFGKRYFSASRYHFYIPADEKYREVNRLAILLGDGDNYRQAVFSEDLNISVVGTGRVDTVAVDSLFSIIFDNSNLFSPRFIELSSIPVHNRHQLGLNSDVYELLPEVFATRANFVVSLGMDKRHRFDWNEASGLAWLDEKEDKWVWLADSENRENRLFASSQGGGKYGALIDAVSPFIEGKNIVQGRTFRDSRPIFEFRIGDSLSGIENDESIVITIDDEWQIPEYDPERELCVSQPQTPLTPGEHMLRVVVTDRAGNKFDEAWRFRIAQPVGKKVGAN